jgi:hypothetical protein
VEAEAVGETLAQVDADPSTVLWEGAGTTLLVSDVAAAAVLAGCQSSYFPVVLGAVQAYLDSLGGDGLGVPTLVEASQCVVVNGPVRNRIDLNCGFALYGPGWQANATIGRALRFVVRQTLGDGLPSFGDPGQYTLCFGEDEESSPWTPLHVQRGGQVESSAVTVLSTVTRSMCHDRGSKSAEALLDRLVIYGRGKVSGSGWFGDDPCSLLLIFPPDSRLVLEGWSKEAVHEYLFERMVADDGSPIQPVRLSSPDDLVIVAAGGRAFSAVQFMLSHRFSPVTRQVLER